MGQDITVRRREARRPDVAVFETNRSLTGMGHERYASAADINRDRPVDAVARRLFDHGGVEAVHVYSNVITVDLAPGADVSGLAEAIERLFTHYREGVTPTVIG